MLTLCRVRVQIKKHPDTPDSLMVHAFRFLGRMFGFPGWAAACATFYFFLPGLWVGQVIGYFCTRSLPCQ